MSLIEPSNTMGPDPAAPADPNVSYFDKEPLPAEGTPVPAPQDVGGGEDEQDVFDRKYVEQLRDEAARYRTRARDFEQVFGEMPEDLRTGWLELIRVANSGDEDAMGQLAQMLGFEVQDAEEPVLPTDVPEYLTLEQAREIARQEAWEIAQAAEAQRADAEAIRGVASEAEKLGYQEGSLEYVELLYLANEIDMGSLPPGKSLLQAADEQLQARNQAAYDAWVAKKTQEAGGTPVAPSGNGASPSIANTPKTWDEARAALHERLSNI